MSVHDRGITFYNSPMEACIIICRSKKSGNRKGKILFINAVNEVSREQAQSFLTEQHIKRIDDAYKAFADEGGFAKVMPIDELRDYSLSIPLYVRGNGNSIVAEEPAEYNVADQYQQWCKQTEDLYDKLEKLIASLEAAEVGA